MREWAHIWRYFFIVYWISKFFTQQLISIYEFEKNKKLYWKNDQITMRTATVYCSAAGCCCRWVRNNLFFLSLISIFFFDGAHLPFNRRFSAVITWCGFIISGFMCVCHCVSNVCIYNVCDAVEISMSLVIISYMI